MAKKMAKKQVPRIHPGDAIRALQTFQESVGYAMAGLQSVARILEDCESLSADQAKVLSQTIRESLSRVSAHWETED